MTHRHTERLERCWLAELGIDERDLSAARALNALRGTSVWLWADIGDNAEDLLEALGWFELRDALARMLVRLLARR